MVRRITCSGCQATWSAREARFCGRCGAPLHGTRGADGGARPPPWPSQAAVTRKVGRLGLTLGLGLAVLGVAGVTVVVLSSSVEFATDALDDEVELPGPAPEDVGDEDPSGPTPTVGAVASLGCEPAGCSLWQGRIGDGAYVVADGVILQAATVGVRAVDPNDGRTLWRRTYVDDGLPPLLDAVEVEVLDDEVVVSSDGGLLQVRDIATGQLRWHAELPVERVTDVAAHRDVVIAVGLPRADQRQPPVAIAAYHRSTGQTLWERALHRAVAIDVDPLVLQPRTLEVVAADPATGATVWTRDVIGPVRGLADAEALALVSPGGVDLIDPRTGELLRTVPRRVSNGGVTRMVGGLLLVDAPSGPDPQATPRSDMTVAVVSDAQRPTWTISGTTAVLETGEGTVVVAHDDHHLSIQLLAPDGETRWTNGRDLVDPTCCWTVEQGHDATTVFLVPPEPGRVPVEVVDLADGRTRTTFAVPTTQVRNTLGWTGGVAIEAAADGTVLTGPRGTVYVGPDAEVLLTDPAPVVRVPGGLLGIDRQVLLPAVEPR